MTPPLTPDQLAELTRSERKALALDRETELLARFIGSTLWRRQPNGHQIYSGNGRKIILAPGRKGRWHVSIQYQWHGPFSSPAEAKAFAFDRCFRDEIGGARGRRRRVRNQEAVA